MDKYGLLKRHFGYDAFRPGQETLIDALCAGRDALGVMPTGAGKSVCYQIPALLLPGVTLVISPLIALMKDQVSSLGQAGVAAAYINSSLTAAQSREVLRRARANAYKIIYVAPERLTVEGFLDFARHADISLIAVDEAHCVSQWGQDFRPGYLNIASFIFGLQKRPPVGAFTATATKIVRADIEKLLALDDPVRVSTGFDRPNLFFDVARPKSKDAYLRSFIAARRGQSGIVYCATRKAVESVCDMLVRSGVPATRYHAGLTDDERRANQDDFVFDRRRVMVATNAFGMGIDKSNVGFVAHYNMPKDVESYYQEAGRAGRDGARADCVLLYSAGDVRTARFLIEHGEENDALTLEERALVRRRDLERLDAMVAYCKTTDCLRGYLLRYFGEQASPSCDNCGNCARETVQKDITVEAQKILSAVARVERKYPYGFGPALIARLLRGSRDQRILRLGLNDLPTYGALRTLDRAQIQDDIDCLINAGYLSLEGEQYPVLRLTQKAGDVLFKGERVIVGQRGRALEESAPAKKGEDAPPLTPDDALFQRLKALRMRLAQREGVPAYVIFSNAALLDMARKRPETMDDFLQVSGVGTVKANRYGKVFLAEINDRTGES